MEKFHDFTHNYILKLDFKKNLLPFCCSVTLTQRRKTRKNTSFLIIFYVWTPLTQALLTFLCSDPHLNCCLNTSVCSCSVRHPPSKKKKNLRLCLQECGLSVLTCRMCSGEQTLAITTCSFSLYHTILRRSHQENNNKKYFFVAMTT